VCALAALLVWGCGGDDGTTGPTDPAIAKTLEAWAQFEAGDLTAAKTTFRDAISVSNGYADAHNGLGWSLALLDSLAESQGAFVAAINNNPPNAEPWAGRAFVRAELSSSDLDDALTDAGIALGRAPRFVFSHDPDVDWRDLRLLRAQLFFELGEIDSSAAEVDSLGGFLPSPSDPAFADSLLREIERLRTVVSPPVL
jgi:tetratricopeptide (TPR) repeat protein